MKPLVVTIIGAESTGKTTLSRELANAFGGDYVPEFARPYLETTREDVTGASMRAIWYGQRALQHAANQSTQQIVIQDTDLFATVGYWQLPHVTPRIGTCPSALIDDAQANRSSLYLITTSNIPFEADPIRYGGDVRESADTYWITLCEAYKLPYRIITSSSPNDRLTEAVQIISERRSSCVD